LNRLALFMEKAQKIRRQVRAALVYPSAILGIAAAVTAFVLVFVIPTFERLFTGLGGVLPLPTRMVIAASDFLTRYFVVVVLALVTSALFARACYRTDAGRRLADAWLLRVPLVGDLVGKACVARVARTLATMIGSGVPVLESLSISARTAGNRTLEGAI